MQNPQKEPTEQARPSRTEPRQENIGTLNELVDLAREQLDFAARAGVPQAEKTRLVRAATALLSAYLGQVDHVGAWRQIGEVAGVVVERLR